MKAFAGSDWGSGPAKESCDIGEGDLGLGRGGGGMSRAGRVDARSSRTGGRDIGREGDAKDKALSPLVGGRRVFVRSPISFGHGVTTVVLLTGSLFDGIPLSSAVYEVVGCERMGDPTGEETDGGDLWSLSQEAGVFSFCEPPRRDSSSPLMSD